MPIDTPEWVRDAVFYQLFPDRFARSARLVPAGPFEPWEAAADPPGFKGGDLFGIAERLPELEELGITALYLTPIFSSASNHRYHAYDYKEVDPLLGGETALRELLDRAHERGIRVILDGVFNHCGRGLWQFHHVLENGASSPYRDWFHLDPAVLSGAARAQRLPRPGRGERGGARLQGVVGPARSAEVQHRPSRGPRVPARGRRALAPLRHRRLAAGRTRRDRRPGVLAGVPSALPGDQP